MVRYEEEKWLKKALNSCFRNKEAKITKEKKQLEGFSLLIRHMAENIERLIHEVELLWQTDPASQEVKKKFDAIKRSLSYLRRYCEKKIENRHK